jgi:hypothetical protein
VIQIDLRGGFGPQLELRPCRGLLAWNAWNVETGALEDTAALKELLHRIADRLPRMESPRRT